jgi:hypothetical protein
VIASDGDAVALPPTLLRAVRAEFGRAFHPPYEVLIVVAINGLLMTGLWFWAPQSWKNALFSLHGTLAFAMVLACWMLADVPATNLLGADARRMRAALDDPTMFRRLLYAKNLVLWTLVAPLCSVVAVAIGLHAHDYAAMALSIMAIAVMPFGALGISAWLGIRFPYHPIGLSVRWAHRRPWRHMIVRWLSLTLTPYGLVPALGVLFLAPSLVLWAIFAKHGLNGRLSDGEFAWGILLGCGLAVIGSVGGHHVGQRWAHRRREELAAYLADPALG